MNKLNDEMITKLVDTLDEASMLYYHAMINEEIDNTAVTNYDKEHGRLNYYECLLKVIDFFIGSLNIEDSLLDDETKEKINQLFNTLDMEIEKQGLNNEEVRKALLLLDIKGFKNLNFSLDLITPDNIGYIIVKLIDVMFKQKKIKMLDFNFGIGNLAFTIVNNSDKTFELVGMDNHALMANVSVHKANLLQENINFFHQDALEYLPNDIDLVVSDLAVYDYDNPKYKSKLYDEGVRYFPYLAIEHYLALKDGTKYIYIIDSNFFSQKGSEKLKQLIDDSTSIKAFITLPVDMFQNESVAKALLIIEKKVTTDKHIPIFMLPPLKKKEAFLNTMGEILNELK